MYTSIVMVALAGSMANPAAVTNSPSWHRDYDEAYRLGSREHKPLAVFLSPVPMSWQKVVKEGKLNEDAEKLLQEHYVCVCIDTSKTAGAELAKSFEMSDGTGLILSDHTGKAQAFRHAGSLSSSDLEKHLRKYADPERVVRRTETHGDEPIRYYSQPPVISYPFGSMGGFSGGRGC